MAGDFAYALADKGQTLAIDDAPVLCFAPQPELSLSEFERATLERRRIYHLAGAIVDKTPGQIVDIGGERWTVIGHLPAGLSVCLTVERSSG